jgi:1-deoxy-D-xylulose-5-phosphate reductoisomerase
MIKRIAILGSTGSIGTSALAVVDRHRDRVKVVGLAAGSNVALLAEQVARYRPRAIALSGPDEIADLERLRGGLHGMDTVGTGADGLVAVATHPAVEVVLCATTGTVALEAILAAIEAGKTIALANKEVLVMAGGLMMEAARRHGVTILPVDSEHSAIHQCLHGRAASEIKRLVLTASGGPFRHLSAARLDDVAPGDALRHPTWTMGRKITIDSATLMNKGLEVIEARWLFGIPPERVDVVIHPQSIVHSMVELRDGSVIAQMGVADMRLPIQYVFSYPDRWDAPVPSLDLTRLGRLEFETPDVERFPCLALAYRALDDETSLPVVLNAANEVAVAAFLDGVVAFPAIPRIIDRALAATPRPRQVQSLADVRALDRSARQTAQRLVQESGESALKSTE